MASSVSSSSSSPSYSKVSYSKENSKNSKASYSSSKVNHSEGSSKHSKEIPDIMRRKIPGELAGIHKELDQSISHDKFNIRLKEWASKFSIAVRSNKDVEGVLKIFIGSLQEILADAISHDARDKRSIIQMCKWLERHNALSEPLRKHYHALMKQPQIPTVSAAPSSGNSKMDKIRQILAEQAKKEDSQKSEAHKQMDQDLKKISDQFSKSSSEINQRANVFEKESVDKLNAREKVFKEEMDKIDARVDQFEKEIVELEARNKELEQGMKKLDQDINNVEQQDADLRKKIDETKKEIEQKKKKKEILKKVAITVAIIAACALASWALPTILAELGTALNSINTVISPLADGVKIGLTLTI